VLGGQQVQGLDYAYTLQGWLKGVNSISLNAGYDMGEDGKSDGQSKNIARDAIGFNLNYYAGDYSSISGANPFPGTSAFLAGNYRPLYNGNISSMAVNIGKFNNPVLYNYTYDQLNRITAMDAFKGLDTSNSWSGLTAMQDYKERVSYDANGNILRYLRNGYGSKLLMDSLTYKYNRDSEGRLTNNMLSYVKDSVGAAEYAEDLDSQGSGNYTYDAIGNLVKDVQAGIDSIEWTVYGKISNIVKGNGTTIKYSYDASGNRISKAVEDSAGAVKYTWYVRDAQGNVMATYNSAGSGTALNDYTLKLSEQHIYGSSRIGIINREVNMKAAFISSDSLIFKRGEKQYELSNHLGNVLTTISDKKKASASDTNSSLIDHYTADIRSAQDYYPFGMLMPGRRGYLSGTTWTGTGGGGFPNSLSLDNRTGNTPSEYKAAYEIDFVPNFESGSGDEFEAFITSEGSGGGVGGSESGSSIYRYGFNGKENDNEVKGEGNQQDYGMRIYDPRLGKFLSVDPLTMEYPWYSPYQFAGNKPIWAIDLDGTEEAYSNVHEQQKQQALLRIENEKIVAMRKIGTIKTWDLSAGKKLYDHFNSPLMQPWFTSNPIGVAEKYLFTLADDVKILGTSFASSGRNARHIGGDRANFDSRLGAFANVSTTLLGPAINSETKPITGGRYGDISKSEFFDVHEMPSKSTLKKFGIASGDAPAVKMPTPAHTKTGSFRNSRAAQAFRAKEETLIKEQKFDELWKMLQNDYNSAMKSSNFKIDNTAVNQAKRYWQIDVVPKLKK
jgi:RHS repeat-associated protein